MSETKNDIFRQFVDEYVRYSKDDTPPVSADQDVKYALQLQADRAKQLGYAIEYDIEPDGVLVSSGVNVRHWKDAIYDNYQQFQSCIFTKTIYKDGKLVHKKKQHEIFYEIITDYLEPEPIADELYVCPGCGGVVKVRELEDGCPYCGSHFKMDELFPKVTNFFKVKEIGADSKKEVKKSVTIGILLAGLVAFFFIDLNSANLLIRVIKSALFGVLVGGFLGYLLYACKLIGGTFYEAGRTLGPLIGMLGSKNKFMNYMKRYTPDFSYQYFTSKVCSLVQTIIFSDAKTQIPFYQGEPLGDRFEDILESNMFGNPVLQSFQVKGRYVYLKVKVYMDNTYATDKGVKFKRDIYYLDMYRNIAKPVNFNFSIHKIACKSCNGSFDAGKHTNCPYCGSPYPFEEDEWMITNIRSL